MAENSNAPGAAQAKAAKPEKGKKKMLRIRSMKDGLRRGGIAHPRGPVDHELAAFTKEQRQAIEAEPLLHVEEVEVDAKGKKEGDPDDEGD